MSNPTLYTRVAVRARKPHTCCECSTAIEARDTYISTTGLWDGEFETYKQCVACAELFDSLVVEPHDERPLFSMLYEEFEPHEENGAEA